MSAFVLGEKHIDLLVSAACRWNVRWTEVKYDGQKVDHANGTAIGALLLTENILSVMYRYPDSEITDLPGPIPTPQPKTFRHRLADMRIEPVQVLKAISCYEYQSCEHPGWERSAAKSFCEELRGATITRLPGYEEAAWEL